MVRGLKGAHSLNYMLGIANQEQTSLNKSILVYKLPKICNLLGKSNNNKGIQLSFNCEIKSENSNSNEARIKKYNVCI